MNYDDQRIDDAVLALLAAFSDSDSHTWKGHDFDVMKRLHQRGFIGDPVNKNKGLYLTNEGMERGRELADELFGSVRAPGR